MVHVCACFTALVSRSAARYTSCRQPRTSRRHDHDSYRPARPGAARTPSQLALQHRLGVLPERWAWSHSSDPCRPGADRPALTGTAEPRSHVKERPARRSVYLGLPGRAVALGAVDRERAVHLLVEEHLVAVE